MKLIIQAQPNTQIIYIVDYIVKFWKPFCKNILYKYQMSALLFAIFVLYIKVIAHFYI